MDTNPNYLAWWESNADAEYYNFSSLDEVWDIAHWVMVF
jgi:hypothetical protein